MASTQKARRQEKVADDRCECGNRITPLAKRLQPPNPGLKRKCFACLVHDREVKVVTL